MASRRVFDTVAPCLDDGIPGITQRFRRDQESIGIGAHVLPQRFERALEKYVARIVIGHRSVLGPAIDDLIEVAEPP
jgi:hypothetical protein